MCSWKEQDTAGSGSRTSWNVRLECCINPVCWGRSALNTSSEPVSHLCVQSVNCSELRTHHLCCPQEQFRIQRCFLFYKERFPEGDQDHVPAEEPEHHPAAGRVCAGRPPVHDHRVHGERRPQPVPVPEGDLQQICHFKQYPLCHVREAACLFGINQFYLPCPPSRDLPTAWPLPWHRDTSPACCGVVPEASVFP